MVACAMPPCHEAKRPSRARLHGTLAPSAARVSRASRIGVPASGAPLRGGRDAVPLAIDHLASHALGTMWPDAAFGRLLSGFGAKRWLRGTGVSGINPRQARLEIGHEVSAGSVARWRILAILVVAIVVPVMWVGGVQLAGPDDGTLVNPH